MTDLALITAETILVKQGEQEVPCVVLVGRDNKGKKRMYRVPFMPYFYINEADYTELKISKEFNFDYYCVPRETFVRGLNKRALTKLEFPNSKWLTKCANVYGKLHKKLNKPFFTYEVDLSKPGLLALRYMIDKGIRSGVSITKIRDKTLIKPLDLNCNLRKWYIDFESYASKMCSMGLKRKVPITMCSYWDSYREVMRTLYVKNPKWKKPFNPEPLFKEHELEEFKSEAFLLEGLRDDVQKFDPDLITAWNLDRYDFPKWVTRMKACKLEPKALSPFRSFSWKRPPYRLKGRILFDLMKGFKRFTDAELRSYSLAYVIESEELTADKILFKGTAAETWDKYPDILLQRNVNDVLVMKELDDKYDLVETFDDLRRTFGALFHEVLMNYRVLDSALMRFVNNKVALKTVYRKSEKKGKYLGAVVIEPDPAIYEWVVQFDFSREYPNIIKAFNIGPETYRADGSGFYKIDGGDGVVHSFVRNPKSLLAQLIDSFFKLRDKYEKEYQKAIDKGNKVDIKKWWRRIFNVKKMTNAIYGVMAYSGFRLSKEECSMAVALIGREGVQCLNRIAVKIGYRIIYGDTDSIFVKLKGKFGTTKEAYLKEGQWLTGRFNKGLSKYFIKKHKIDKAPSDLGLKQIYKLYLLIAKKSYAGKYVYDERKGWKEDYVFKGIEVIRSDSSDLEKDTLETIIKMALNGKSIKDIKEYFIGVIKAFRAKEFNYLQVSYPLQIRHSFNSYFKKNKRGNDSTVPSHVRAALYSNKFVNTGFEIGDKPRRLPIKIKSKIVVNKAQTMLFSRDVFYPTQWTYFTDTGKTRTWDLKDISVAEDMVVPKWFLDNMDWDRIYNRLVKKVNKIIKLVREAKWVDVGLKGK